MTLARYQHDNIPVLTTARDRINEREERNIATTQCLVASGINSSFHELPVNGSRKMADYLQNRCRAEYGACWQIKADPGKLAQGLVDLIEDKRLNLKGE